MQEPDCGLLLALAFLWEATGLFFPKARSVSLNNICPFHK
uniref:Uncharacterized protein n=1 Tax=Leptospira santarosai serovar Arenal str. MAVJ 401 TaxID=1049976 RepID=M6JSI8_9LEPT|nr:hypothetical protein LEP1GSC063_4217 [Leptospira santarosai serovar Arenal str. MAVJ 401]EMN22578.1 hypothetical protein LEP1GSC063_4219 [Leptospira santarosai serovar Arenal str. MAVJ 401]EMN23693.1 hypothetical protein LEP1GSC063_1387 [Leptospira santarosai serovar Arenal str. MAVJ 401]